MSDGAVLEIQIPRQDARCHGRCEQFFDVGLARHKSGGPIQPKGQAIGWIGIRPFKRLVEQGGRNDLATAEGAMTED